MTFSARPHSEGRSVRSAPSRLSPTRPPPNSLASPIDYDDDGTERTACEEIAGSLANRTESLETPRAREQRKRRRADEDGGRTREEAPRSVRTRRHRRHPPQSVESSGTEPPTNITRSAPRLGAEIASNYIYIYIYIDYLIKLIIIAKIMTLITNHIFC